MSNTKNIILAAAVHLARAHGWARLKRESVAMESGCAAGSINANFGSMDGLRDEVMRVAVERQFGPIVLEGIAARNAIAKRADLVVRFKDGDAQFTWL